MAERSLGAGLDWSAADAELDRVEALWDSEPVTEEDRSARFSEQAKARWEGRTRPCGTPGAYHRHRRHGEDPCDDCKRAIAEDSRRKRQHREACRG